MAVLQLRAELRADGKIFEIRSGLHSHLWRALASEMDGTADSLSVLALKVAAVAEMVHSSAARALDRVKETEFASELSFDPAAPTKDKRDLTISDFKPKDIVAYGVQVTAEETRMLYFDGLATMAGVRMDAEPHMIGELPWVNSTLSACKLESINGHSPDDVDALFTEDLKYANRIGELAKHRALWRLATILPELNFKANSQPDPISKAQALIMTLKRFSVTAALTVIAPAIAKASYAAAVMFHPLFYSTVDSTVDMSDLQALWERFSKTYKPLDLFNTFGLFTAAMGYSLPEGTMAPQLAGSSVTHLSTSAKQLLLPDHFLGWALSATTQRPTSDKKTGFAQAKSGIVNYRVGPAFEESGYLHPLRQQLQLKNPAAANDWPIQARNVFLRSAAVFREALSSLERGQGKMALIANVLRHHKDESISQVGVLAERDKALPYGLQATPGLYQPSDDTHIPPVIVGTGEAEPGTPTTLETLLQRPLIPVQIGSTLPMDIAPFGRIYDTALPERLLKRGLDLTYEDQPVIPFPVKLADVHADWFLMPTLDLLFELWPIEYIASAGYPIAGGLDEKGISSLMTVRVARSGTALTGMSAHGVVRALERSVMYRNGDLDQPLLQSLATAVHSIGSLVTIPDPEFKHDDYEGLKQILHAATQSTPIGNIVVPYGEWGKHRLGRESDENFFRKAHEDVTKAHVTWLTPQTGGTPAIPGKKAKRSVVAFVRYSHVPAPVRIDAALLISVAAKGASGPALFTNSAKPFVKSSGFTHLPGRDCRTTAFMSLPAGVRYVNEFNLLLQTIMVGARTLFRPVAASLNAALIANDDDVLPALSAHSISLAKPREKGSSDSETTVLDISESPVYNKATRVII